jgi:hypothetical protein
MRFSSPGLEKLTFYLALFLGARSGQRFHLYLSFQQGNYTGEKFQPDGLAKYRGHADCTNNLVVGVNACFRQ